MYHELLPVMFITCSLLRYDRVTSTSLELRRAPNTLPHTERDCLMVTGRAWLMKILEALQARYSSFFSNHHLPWELIFPSLFLCFRCKGIPHYNSFYRIHDISSTRTITFNSTRASRQCRAMPIKGEERCTERSFVSDYTNIWQWISDSHW